MYRAEIYIDSTDDYFVVSGLTLDEALDVVVYAKGAGYSARTRPLKIRQLRSETGCGLDVCREAYELARGDMTNAKRLLRSMVTIRYREVLKDVRGNHQSGGSHGPSSSN